jgi:hypothetical protein
MKYLEHILETYVYSHYNLCTIPIYFYNRCCNTCNIPLKHLKHLNILLQHVVSTLLLLCDATHIGGTADSNKPAAEDGGPGAAWQQLAAPASRPGQPEPPLLAA